jgi:hypothetical protein
MAAKISILQIIIPASHHLRQKKISKNEVHYNAEHKGRME